MKQPPILIYSITFLILALLFNLVGIINVGNYEILAYTFSFYGLSNVYASMGHNKKLQLFLGSSVFLIGIDFLIISLFDVFNTSGIIFPSIVLIISISSFILFLDNTDDKAILFVSIIFALLGIIYSTSAGNLRIISFINSLTSIASGYWIMLIIVLVVFILIRRNEE